MKNNRLELDLNFYYHEIKKQLVCKSSKKKKLIMELKGNIAEFLEDNPNSSINVITQHFGTPEDIADGYISSMEGGELGSNLQKSKWFRRIITMALLVIVAIVSLVCIIELLDNHNYAQSSEIVEVGEESHIN